MIDENMIYNEIEEMVMACPDGCANKDMGCRSCYEYSNFIKKDVK